MRGTPGTGHSVLCSCNRNRRNTFFCHPREEAAASRPFAVSVALLPLLPVNRLSALGGVSWSLAFITLAGRCAPFPYDHCMENFNDGFFFPASDRGCETGYNEKRKDRNEKPEGVLLWEWNISRCRSARRILRKS